MIELIQQRQKSDMQEQYDNNLTIQVFAPEGLAQKCICVYALHYKVSPWRIRVLERVGKWNRQSLLVIALKGTLAVRIQYIFKEHKQSEQVFRLVKLLSPVRCRASARAIGIK